MKKKLFTLLMGSAIALGLNAADVALDLTSDGKITPNDKVSVDGGALKIVHEDPANGWLRENVEMTYTFNTEAKYNYLKLKVKLPIASAEEKRSLWVILLKDDQEVFNAWSQEITVANEFVDVKIELLQDNPDGSRSPLNFSFNKIQFMPRQLFGGWASESSATYFIKDVVFEEGTGMPKPESKAPGKIFEAPKLVGTIDFDGFDNEDFYDVPPVATNDNNVDGNPINGKSGVQWQSFWDNDYLYFFFNVADENVVLHNDPEFATWKGDGVQVYIDCNDRRVDNKVFGNWSGFSVNPKREDVEGDLFYQNEFNKMNGFQKNVLQKSVVDGNGYTIEMRLPWKGLYQGIVKDSAAAETYVPGQVKAGLKIAFDLQLNDNEPGAGRVNMISWCSKPKEPYNNSGTWGQIVLKGDGSNVVMAKNEQKLVAYAKNGIISVRFDNLKSVELYSITGAKVSSAIASGNNVNISANGLSGIYLVKAYNTNGGSAVSKLVVK